MLCLLLTVLITLSSGVVEGGNTVYPNSEITNLTIAINKLLTQFTHKCPITEQSNSRDTINELMQLAQAIEGLNNSNARIIDRLDSLTDAVSNFSCPDNYCCDSFLPSCEAIHKKWPDNPSGYYNITGNNGSVHQVYCHMERLCNLGGGWMRIANLNMMDSESDCSDGFSLYSKGGVHACGRPATSSGSCVGTIFSSSGIKYSQVCGKVIGYQVGWPDGSRRSDSNIKNNINTYYVDGVSLTHGNPKKHIWSLICGTDGDDSTNCPCASHGTQPVPSFVGPDYYCESGFTGSQPVSGKFYSSDRLWDGKYCGSSETACCQRPLIPWFYKSIGYYTTDYIEMRICCDEGTNDEDVPVEQYELYVK